MEIYLFLSRFYLLILAISAHHAQSYVEQKTQRHFVWKQETIASFYGYDKLFEVPKESIVE